MPYGLQGAKVAFVSQIYPHLELLTCIAGCSPMIASGTSEGLEALDRYGDEFYYAL